MMKMKIPARGFGLALLCALSLCAGGCTFEAGAPFAALDARLDARLDAPADRARGDGWMRLSSDYEVRVSRAELELVRFELVQAAGSESRFDASRPPPGYSLCHNGHCHHDSGRLVSYEEIEAELGGGRPAAPVATLPVGLVALVPGEARALPCEPSCDLPRGRLSRVRAPLVRFAFEGEVRDTRVPSRLRPAALRFVAGGSPAEARTPAATGSTVAQAPALAGPLDLVADREDEPSVELTISVRLGPRVFDAIDWASLEVAAGVVDLAAPAHARALETLQSALLETELGASVKRGPL